MDNSIQNLAEKIIMLNPENKKMMINIVDQFLISETAAKLGISPIDVKSIMEKSVQQGTKGQ